MSTQINSDHDVEQTIIRYLEKRFPAHGPFEPNSDLLDSGTIDSLGFLDLMMFLSEEFNISLEDDDFTPENISTPALLVSFVKKAA